MEPSDFATYIQYLCENGKLSADAYNTLIYPAVQQGAILDITPKNEPITDPTIAVQALIEFPSGKKFWIIAHNLALEPGGNPNRPRYTFEVKPQI